MQLHQILERNVVMQVGCRNIVDADIWTWNRNQHPASNSCFLCHYRPLWRTLESVNKSNRWANWVMFTTFAPTISCSYTYTGACNWSSTNETWTVHRWYSWAWMNLPRASTVITLERIDFRHIRDFRWISLI